MPFKISSTAVCRGSFLKINFNVKNIYDDTDRPKTKFETEAIDIDNLAKVWFKFTQTLPADFSELSGQINPISIKMKISLLTSSKVEGKNTSSIAAGNIHVDCKALNYSEQFLLSCNRTLTLHMGMITGKSDGIQHELEPFDVIITVSKKEIITFNAIFDDTNFTDFQLSTSEGSVSVHKVCLAAHSQVFKTMLIHDWKETTDASIKIQGVTLETLRDLKTYIYMNSLPDKDEALRALLILASYYLMDILVMDCSRKLAQMLTSKNLQSLLEYACAYNIPKLTFVILEQTPADLVHNAQLNRKLLNQDRNGDLKEDSSNEEEEREE